MHYCASRYFTTPVNIEQMIATSPNAEFSVLRDATHALPLRSRHVRSGDLGVPAPPPSPCTGLDTDGSSADDRPGRGVLHRQAARTRRRRRPRHRRQLPRHRQPSQADADSDGTGDACDPTPVGTTPPTITVPGHITVDATGPAGAIVAYTATATDDLDPAPDPVCTPSAGSLFAIGDTSVTCTATDLGGNTATASFVVTVRGAGDQLADLRTAVDGIGPGYSLINKISYVQAALANNDVPGGCSILSAFVNEVGAQSGKKIPVGTAASLIADASRIQAVLGC